MIDADALKAYIDAQIGRPFIGCTVGEALKILVDEQPTVEAEPRWIPFTLRELTADEKEEHPDWDSILDCKLPDDGQVILVTINIAGHELVMCDTYYDDDGSYLDSCYEIGTEATAWMPLPEPYREDGEQDE